MFKNPPFIILANPRSGSSLLRIICDSHSKIVVPPECGFVEWLFNKYKNWTIQDSSSIIKVDEFVYDLFNSKKFETWKMNVKSVKRLIQRLQPKNYSELVGIVYSAYGLKRKMEVLYWGDKNNYYIKKIKKIHSIFPNAKFIHIIRDGRDVAASYLDIKKIKTNSKYVPLLPKNIEEIANEWVENNNQVTKFFEKLKKDQNLVIRFEDLVLNIQNVCEKVCRFLDAEFDETMLNYHVINQKYKLEPKETLDWKRKTFEKPDKSAIGRYINVLSTEEVANFNKIASNSLRQFGYKI